MAIEKIHKGKELLEEKNEINREYGTVNSRLPKIWQSAILMLWIKCRQ